MLSHKCWFCDRQARKEVVNKPSPILLVNPPSKSAFWFIEFIVAVVVVVIGCKASKPSIRLGTELSGAPMGCMVGAFVGGGADRSKPPSRSNSSPPDDIGSDLLGWLLTGAEMPSSPRMSNRPLPCRKKNKQITVTNQTMA